MRPRTKAICVLCFADTLQGKNGQGFGCLSCTTSEVETRRTWQRAAISKPAEEILKGLFVL